jgi:hypothetical protein
MLDEPSGHRDKGSADRNQRNCERCVILRGHLPIAITCIVTVPELVIAQIPFALLSIVILSPLSILYPVLAVTSLFPTKHVPLELCK